MTTVVVENDVAATEIEDQAETNGTDAAVSGDDSESVDSLLDGVDLGDDVPAEKSEETPADSSAKTEETPAPTEPIPSSLDSETPDQTPAEILELRQQLARLQTVVEELRYADCDIVWQAARVRELADEVQSCESAAKEAKAELTAAKERLESANRELRSMIGDRASGQRRLKLSVPAPTGEKSADSAAAGQWQSVVSQVLAVTANQINAGKLNTGELTVTATVGGGPATSTGPAAVDEHAASPISILSQKQMLAQFGQDEFEAAKNREEPFGLAKGEMEKLEAAEIQTIGDLEKMMREDAYWHQKMKGLGEKKIAKVIESLRVWRGKFPMPG